MDNFKIETSFQFPIFKLCNSVTYSEVKKPSGIAYLLLVLINESKDKKIKLRNQLINFGVPSTFNEIFADVLDDLIEKRILTTNDINYNKSYFDEYSISDFKFTDIGKKIFKEEAIPTGANKDIKVSIYYDIVYEKLLLSINKEFEPKPLMNTAIDEDFYEYFNCDKDIEAFININKGNKMEEYAYSKKQEYKVIKKEEVVTNVDEFDREPWLVKYDATIKINGDNLDFFFDDQVIKNFFIKYYNTDIVNNFISYKNKFKFNNSYHNNLHLSDYNSNIIDVLLPIDLNNIVKQRCELLITRGNYIIDGCQTIINNDCLNLYNKNCEFIIIDKAYNKYAYIPGIFDFYNKHFGVINLPLVLKTNISNDEIKSILSPYIGTLTEYSKDNFKTLINICSLTKDYDRANLVLEGYLGDKIANNLNILNEIRPLVTSDIKNKYKELLHKNYFSCLNEVTIDNIDTILKVTNDIPRYLNINDNDILKVIFNNLNVIKNKTNLFELLINNKFETGLVLSYLNPLEEVLKNKLAKISILQDLINYDNNINKLKKLSNVYNYSNYSIDLYNINKSEFKNIYITAKSLEKNINIFEVYNKDIFNDYSLYMNIFTNINDDINMEDEAIKNKNKIKKELIDKKIDTGDYQFVFVNLAAKLEVVLNTKYQLSGHLNDMLNQARKRGIINKNIVSELHNFREYRNSYVHSKTISDKFTVDDLRYWTKLIFELEGDKL